MSKGGRYDPMPEDEAAALGKALLASMRGDRLTASQRALIARARAADEPQAPMPVLEDNEVLATFSRGEDAEIRLSWRSFRGSSPFLDLRRFERAPEGMKATRQGITIRARELGQLMTALVAAMRKIEPPPDVRSVAEPSDPPPDNAKNKKRGGGRR